MNPTYPYYGEQTVCCRQPVAFPPQHQPRQPGLESLMIPRPTSEDQEISGSSGLHPCQWRGHGHKLMVLTG